MQCVGRWGAGVGRDPGCKKGCQSSSLKLCFRGFFYASLDLIWCVSVHLIKESLLLAPIFSSCPPFSPPFLFNSPSCQTERQYLGWACCWWMHASIRPTLPALALILSSRKKVLTDGKMERCELCHPSFLVVSKIARTSQLHQFCCEKMWHLGDIVASIIHQRPVTDAP